MHKDYLNKIAGESDFLTFGAGEVTETVEQETSTIENILEKDNSLFIIAEVDGEIAGGLRFSGGFRNRTAHTGEFGTIRKINLRVRTDNIRGNSTV